MNHLQILAALAVNPDAEYKELAQRAGEPEMQRQAIETHLRALIRNGYIRVARAKRKVRLTKKGLRALSL